MRSLRVQFTLFGALLAVLLAALAVVMVLLYRSSAGAQIDDARGSAERSCRAIAARYAQSVPTPSSATPKLDLLQVLLQLVLRETPHVEGGVWQERGGLLAYAYPTYEGSGVKRDVPQAEQPLILELTQRAARLQEPQIDVVRGSREALIVAACPLAAPASDLAAWTMTRTHAGALAAQGSLYVGLAVLLTVVLVSALWLSFVFRRGMGHVARLEEQIAQTDEERVPELTPTGLHELDRIVDSFNHHRARFEQARAQLQLAAQQRSRDQRLAALGRMTGGIAHEIRNPIAAMRLKAENALAAAPERHGDALAAIVGQIDRLDGLVQSLLALVQPVQLTARCVDLPAWLAERLAGVERQASQRGVRLALRHAGPAQASLDPVHLARAIDNLLDNAVRHAPAGGEVLLSAGRTPAGALLIAVDDEGSGVPDALQPQLFEPFATGRADGTGLGLALAREVALAHGGELRHVARAPGARFELEMPWHAC